MARSARMRRAAAIAVAVVVLGGGSAAWALTRPSGPSYRTAAVGNASVTQTVSSVGTLASANSAAVSFPVAGTVANVAVHLGQHVTAGQPLALLDTTSRQQQFDSATSSLAAAQQSLATDTASQSGTGTASTPSTASGSTGSGASVAPDAAGERALPGAPAPRTAAPSSSRAPGPHAPGTGSGAVPALQQAVLAAQRQIDRLLGGLDLSGCAKSTSTQFTIQDITANSTVSVTIAVPVGTSAVLMDLSTTISPAQISTVPDQTFTFDGIDTTTHPGPYSVQFTLPATSTTSYRCATQTMSELQRQVSSAEGALNRGIGQLTAGLAATTAQHPSAAAPPASSPVRRSGAAPAPNTSSRTQATSGSGTGAVPTAKVATALDIAADQANVDSDDAQLTLARQDLAAATITTPITGQVADVALAAGQSVSADSQTAAITVLGSGIPIVQTTVPITDLDEVHVGQRAQVSVDGDPTTIPGTVSQIGVLDTSTGTATVYPVTVQLAATGARLLDSAGADVTITVQTVAAALSVPTSAVHTLGPLHTVQVLSAGKLTTVRVQIGAMGEDRTQITSGLKAGQQVVLATISEPLPSNSTLTNRGTAGLTGGTGPRGRAGG